MKKTILSRKEFIIKSGKCIGGLACTSLASSIIQSCTKPNPISNLDLDILFLSTCNLHLATFNQNGENIGLPTTGWENALPLDEYPSEILYNDKGIEDEIIIYNNNNSITLTFSDHENLRNTDGVSITNANIIDSKGLLLYKKNINTIIVFSRKCPHAGGLLSNFL